MSAEQNNGIDSLVALSKRLSLSLDPGPPGEAPYPHPSEPGPGGK